MIHVDLPDVPAAPLVRGLAACLSSVTEVPLTDLPDLGDARASHLLGAYRSWLAGRGSGLIPIHDPRPFQWAGYWFTVVDGSDSPLADGPQRQVAVLALGTPPGVVLTPQDPRLLGRATADLAISSAYAVELLAVAPQAEALMQLVEQARALPGRGLQGDRYAAGAGTFSPRGAHKPGYELTLIAAEVLEGLTARDAAVEFTSTRRNILTRGIDVNALVGREFMIGDVR